MTRFVLALCASILAGATASASGPPRFEDYPVTDIFRGEAAAPVLATKDARMFRTELRRQASMGPNFAGHFTLARWGCGAGCTTVAVIDAISGHVWFAPFSFADAMRDQRIICHHMSDFDITSELLIVEGELSRGGDIGKHYFRWHNHQFTRVYFEEGCSVH